MSCRQMVKPVTSTVQPVISAFSYEIYYSGTVLSTYENGNLTNLSLHLYLFLRRSSYLIASEKTFRILDVYKTLLTLAEISSLFCKPHMIRQSSAVQTSLNDRRIKYQIISEQFNSIFAIPCRVSYEKGEIKAYQN